MAAFPKSVRINGRPWGISLVPPEEIPGSAGECHQTIAAIKVSTANDAFDLKDTTLHELFHAILRQQAREDMGEVEEHFVRALATGLMGVIQDNPKFSQWLIEPITK